MPVALVGPAGPLARALVGSLVAAGGDVRAAAPARADAEALRALGAKAAVVDPADPSGLRPVVADAHTLCLLPSGPYLAAEPIEEIVAAGVRAARRAELVRVLLRSHPWADPAGPHPYLRAAGRAEEAVRAAGLEHAILRAAHLVGPGDGWFDLLQRLAARRRPIVPGDGRQVLRPLLVEDAAAVFAAADDRSARVEGTFALRGLQQVTAGELVSGLAGGRAARAGPDERTARREGIPVETLGLLRLGDEPSTPDAALEFGILPRPWSLRDYGR